ncbi:uncharacterized protein LOC134527787 isoform X4 [Bacillus rossius redtenbacheri]|uniref:uncharacterized protein LOC134527787 isoform X4 n=1 Tax=Bacillus rossius redtenbacheri TaxID=93214 RepID=UPI002FDE1AED
MLSLFRSSTPTRKNGDPSNVGATGSDGSILLDMDTCQINVIESAYTEPSAANDSLASQEVSRYLLPSSTPTRKNGDPSNVGATGSDGSILLDMDTCQINVIESAYTEPSAANDSLASQEVSRYLLPSSTPTRKNGDPSNVAATGSDGSILLDMDTCQINVIESAYTEPSAANDPSLTHEVPLSPLPELLIESRHEVGDKDSNLNNIEGRRICDIRHVITKARQLEKHNLECKARIKGYFTYTGEKRIGLRSVLHFKCTSCDARTSIDTDPSDTVNTAATWGTVMSGKGHAVIEQLFSLMEIPPASSSTFMKEEREIGKVSACKKGNAKNRLQVVS